MKPLLFLLVCAAVLSIVLLYAFLPLPAMNAMNATASQNLPPCSNANLPTDTARCCDAAQKPSTPLTDDDRIFEKVEVEASVDLAVWRDYIVDRLTLFLGNVAAKIPAGSYKVQVKFVVEKDGCISDAWAMNEPGYGLGKASEDAICEGPQWSPGEVNEVAVRSYHTQPITFVIEEDEDEPVDTLKHNPRRKFFVKPNECGMDTAKALTFFL